MLSFERTLSASLAVSVAFGLAVGAGPAAAAIMTFQDLHNADNRSYTEDGITASYDASVSPRIPESSGSFFIDEYYGPEGVSFSMASPFSAISLDLYGGGIGSFLDCHVSSRGVRSSCSPTALREGGWSFGVFARRVDGSHVSVGLRGNGTHTLGPEFSNLVSLDVAVGGINSLIIQSPVGFFGNNDVYEGNGLGSPEWEYGVMKDDQGNEIFDEEGFLFHEGVYTFSDCFKGCFNSVVDNVVLIPEDDVTPVPLPASAMLASIGLFALALVGIIRRHARAV
jgi:hypothetical protein